MHLQCMSCIEMYICISRAGAGCVSGTCCTFNSPPWFCKTLPHPTTDDIELRLCIDKGHTNNENVVFEKVELYIL